MISNLIFEISNLLPSAAWAANGSSGAPTAPTTPPAALPPMTDIHDIKPLLDMGMDWHWLIWLPAGLLVVAAALLAWRWWRRRRRKSEAPVMVPLPGAEEEANALLDELERDAEVDGKSFYFRLSAILRRYVERRYDFPAAEMTVEELLPRMARLPITRDLSQPFDDLCRRSEPIKFAGAAAGRADKTADLDFAREFVRQTTPAATTPPDGPEAATDQNWAERMSTDPTLPRTTEPSRPGSAEPGI